MPGQDPTSDRPQPLVVWIVDEAAEILGRPSAGKTPAVAALAAQIAATGHRAGIVVTHTKAAPVAVDDGAGLPDLTHLPARDTQAWTRAVREQAETLADRADRAPGGGAVSQ